MKRRMCYETPEAELLVIRYEEGFLQTSPFNGDGNERPIYDGDEEDFN